MRGRQRPKNTVRAAAGPWRLKDLNLLGGQDGEADMSGAYAGQESSRTGGADVGSGLSAARAPIKVEDPDEQKQAVRVLEMRSIDEAEGPGLQELQEAPARGCEGADRGRGQGAGCPGQAGPGARRSEAGTAAVP